MRRVLVILVSLMMLTSCVKDLPTDPEVQTLENFSPHGVWEKTYSRYADFYVNYLSFDTTSGEFIELMDYGYQFYREVDGLFSWDSKTITMNHGSSIAYKLWYQFKDNALSLSVDSMFQNVGTFVRAQSTPKTSSWLEGVDLTSYREIPGLRGNAIGNFAASDSGLFVEAYLNDINYIIRLDFDFNPISLTPIGRCLAFDVDGPFLWMATDTSIEKRILPSMTLVKSFDIRPIIHFETGTFTILGMAVSDYTIYISVNYRDTWNSWGRVYVLDTLGIAGWTFSTNSSIYELAVVDGRLFTVDFWGSNFRHIHTAQGYAGHTYYVNQYKSSLSLRGIASHKGSVFLASDHAYNLAILRIPIPYPDDGLEKETSRGRLTGR